MTNPFKSKIAPFCSFDLGWIDRCLAPPAPGTPPLQAFRCRTQLGGAVLGAVPDAGLCKLQQQGAPRAARTQAWGDGRVSDRRKNVAALGVFYHGFHLLDQDVLGNGVLSFAGWKGPSALRSGR